MASTADQPGPRCRQEPGGADRGTPPACAGCRWSRRRSKRRTTRRARGAPQHERQRCAAKASSGQGARQGVETIGIQALSHPEANAGTGRPMPRFADYPRTTTSRRCFRPRPHSARWHRRRCWCTARGNRTARHLTSQCRSWERRRRTQSRFRNSTMRVIPRHSTTTGSAGSTHMSRGYGARRRGRAPHTRRRSAPSRPGRCSVRPRTPPRRGRQGRRRPHTRRRHRPCRRTSACTPLAAGRVGAAQLAPGTSCASSYP
jgi:hypothetical protein